MSSYRNDNLETVQPKSRPASQALTANTWLKSNLAGEFIPLTPGNIVTGLVEEAVLTTDPNYAVEGRVHVDLVTSTIDRFKMDVTGTATTEMEGLLFDIDPADPGNIDVTVYTTLKVGRINATAFTLGETITGTTSGSTAVVIGIGVDRIVVDTVSAPFEANEIITGSTSGATANVNSHVVGGTQFEITKFITASLVEVGVRYLS